VTAWHVHRGIVRASGGRLGLWPPRPGKWARCGSPREAGAAASRGASFIGYLEDGPNLVSMAMNGWGTAEPAWWLNLQARPEAVVELAGGIRCEVLGRAAGERRA
jgi:F420H(2)-dependent quinone reductase